MSQPVISHNVFSALSKSKKSKPSTKPKVKKVKEAEANHAELEKAIFSAPAAPMTNWADDSDEELELPVTSGMGSDGWNEAPRGGQAARYSPFPEETVEPETDSENEGFEHIDHGDIEAELGLEELKKQELAELDAVLAELGLEDSADAAASPETDAPSSKAAKRRQKKEQRGAGGSGEAADASRAESPELEGEAEEAGTADNGAEAIDPEEARKRAAAAIAAKKRGTANAAKKAISAAAASVASAKAKDKKKKDTSRYNQAPKR